MFDDMSNRSTATKLLILLGALIAMLAIFEGVVSYHDRRVCEKAGGVHTSIGCVDNAIFRAR
jgi:hypothetical protein